MEAQITMAVDLPVATTTRSGSSEKWPVTRRNQSLSPVQNRGSSFDGRARLSERHESVGSLIIMLDLLDLAEGDDYQKFRSSSDRTIMKKLQPEVECFLSSRSTKHQSSSTIKRETWKFYVRNYRNNHLIGGRGAFRATIAGAQERRLVRSVHIIVIAI